MTPEELRKHRIAVATALANGEQGQVWYDVGTPWRDADILTCIKTLFSDCPAVCATVRIKPAKRKCWVGWAPKRNPWIAYDEEQKQEINTRADETIHWQEVEEG